MNITDIISLDFCQQNSENAPKIYAKQLDHNSRTITVALKNNGGSFQPPAGAMILLRGIKPDSTVFDTVGEPQSKSDGRYIFTLTDGMLSSAGTLRCDVACIYSKDEKEIICSTEVFYIIIKECASNPNLPVSQAEMESIYHAAALANAAAFKAEQTADELILARDNGEFDGTCIVTKDAVEEALGDYLQANPIPTQKGDRGEKGEKGEKGDIPQKGVDYWTESDKQEMTDDFSAVLVSELAKRGQLAPLFAQDISQCTDTTKLYVLPDGYIYGYMYALTAGGPNFTNLADTNSSDWYNNHRLNSSGGVTAVDGVIATNFIPAKQGDIIRVQGMELKSYNAAAYNESKVGQNSAKLATSGNIFSDVTLTDNGGQATLIFATTRYVRFSGMPTGEISDIIITVNEEIAYSQPVMEYQWTNTGHAFVPADYEDRIISAEDSIARHGEGIEIISRQLESISEGNSLSSYPAVWDSAVEECISKIKSHQRGINTVTVAFFSDNHNRLGYAGALIARVMQECNIPYCFYGGDSISNGYIETEQEMIAQTKAFQKIMAPLPHNSYCPVAGNHEGFWASSDGHQYRYDRNALFELYFRPASARQNKVFGGDGSYYYVDDPTSKTRFAVLNSNGGSFGEMQIDWLKNSVLSFKEEGWQVMIFSHAPVTNNFHSGITDARLVQQILSAFYTQNTAKLVGCFSGHIHRDRIYMCDHSENPSSDDTVSIGLPFKTVTITSDANLCYDSDAPIRNMAGNTSHAIDFITLDREQGIAYLTRLGAGNDRSFSY